MEGETWDSMPIASMHFSGPLPLVSSLRRSTTLSSSKLIVTAPPASAMLRRSGRWSMATTCRARPVCRRDGVAEDLVGEVLLAVRPFADGEVSALALLTLAADD